jgi:hypothetical protein
VFSMRSTPVPAQSFPKPYNEDRLESLTHQGFDYGCRGMPIVGSNRQCLVKTQNILNVLQ